MDDRRAALYLARGRVAIGLALLVAPGLTGRAWLGLQGATAGAKTMTRLVGVRDAVLGAGAAIAIGERSGGAGWLSMGAIADGADALVSLVGPGIPPRGRIVAAIAAGSAVAHLYLAKRLAEQEGATVDQA